MVILSESGFSTHQGRSIWGKTPFPPRLPRFPEFFFSSLFFQKGVPVYKYPVKIRGPLVYQSISKHRSIIHNPLFWLYEVCASVVTRPFICTPLSTGVAPPTVCYEPAYDTVNRRQKCTGKSDFPGGENGSLECMEESRISGDICASFWGRVWFAGWGYLITLRFK